MTAQQIQQETRMEYTPEFQRDWEQFEAVTKILANAYATPPAFPFWPSNEPGAKCLRHAYNYLVAVFEQEHRGMFGALARAAETENQAEEQAEKESLQWAAEGEELATGRAVELERGEA